MPAEVKRRAKLKAAGQGISLAEYLRRLVAADLVPQKPTRPEISRIFDVGGSSQPTDVARDKDQLIGEAVSDNSLRKMGRRPKHPRQR